MSKSNIKSDPSNISVHSDSISEQISIITKDMQNALSIPDDKLEKIDYIEYAVELVPKINVKMHLK